VSYILELRRFVGSRPLISVGACVFVLDDAGRVLLQHRTDDDQWGIPGGSMDLGESLEDCARRELREETGLEAGVLELRGVLSGPEFYHRYPNGDEIYMVGAMFLAHDVRGIPRVNDQESVAFAYFDLHALPEKVNVVSRRALEWWRAELENV
jgi:8-oxo-dGTP pyrophosphatase MutT (NUDIX family)